jgi:hypothetical protein
MIRELMFTKTQEIKDRSRTSTILPHARTSQSRHMSPACEHCNIVLVQLSSSSFFRSPQNLFVGSQQQTNETIEDFCLDSKSMLPPRRPSPLLRLLPSTWPTTFRAPGLAVYSSVQNLVSDVVSAMEQITTLMN